MTSRSGLPAQLTDIIGREHETQELRRILLSEDTRMVTLTGPGGIGKTRLAIHTAALLADSFDDGILFVPLAHITDPALVLIAIARELGIQTDGATPVRQSLFSFLRRRRMLLVLDNFEQIVDAATDVAAILAECEHIKILVTSRIVLHVRGEHEFPVPPLALPASDAATDSLSQYAAVLLFIQRATAVRPDFRLTNANAPAVAEICSRLDGLPLAIELAAARVKILTPQAMLPRLNNRLQLLKGGAVDLPERQQTLRNTIAWSYELLEETEQDLFRKLAVFQGYWNLEAAEAICGDGEDILEGVQSLVDKSMVQQRELAGGEQYFILLETLREFAWEHLQAAGDTTTLQERHADYYLVLAEIGEYQADDIYLQWMLTVENSFGNLRSAFYYFLSVQSAEKMGRLFVALTEFWSSTAVNEALLWKRQLEPYTEAMPLAIRAEVYNMGGYFSRNCGNIPEAIALYSSTLPLFATLDDKRNYYSIQSNLAMSHTLIGEYEQAEQLFDEAIQYQRAENDRVNLAKTLMYYSNFCGRQGERERAIEVMSESNALFSECGLLRRTASSLSTLAALYAQSGRLQQAIPLAEESLALSKQFADRRSELKALIVLAGINLELKHYPETGALLIQAVTAGRDADSPRSVLAILMHFAQLFLNMDSAALAAHILGCAHTMLQDFESEYNSTFGRPFEELEAKIRAVVSEEEFTAAWNEGKERTIESLEPIIRSSLHKAAPEPEPVAPQKSAPSTVPTVLTSREVETLRLLAQGLSNREIGEKLFISERTVHAHVRSIYSKLDLTSRSAATRFAIENGIV